MECTNSHRNGCREKRLSVLGQNMKGIDVLILKPPAEGDSSSTKNGKKIHRVVFNVNGRKLRPGEEDEGMPEPVCRSNDRTSSDMNNNENKAYDSLTLEDIFVTINKMSLSNDFPRSGSTQSAIIHGSTRAHPVSAPKRSGLKLEKSGLSELFLPICPRSGFLARTTQNGSKTQGKLNELQISAYSCIGVSSETREESEETWFQKSEVNDNAQVISTEKRRNSTAKIEESVETIPSAENSLDSNIKLENGNERSVEETNSELKCASHPKHRGEDPRGNNSNEADDIIHNSNDEEPDTSHESNIIFGRSKLCKQFLKSKIPKSTKQSILIGDVVNEVNTFGRKGVDVNVPRRTGVKTPVTIGKIMTMRGGLGVGIR